MSHPRECGTCERFVAVGDRGECHLRPPGPDGWARVEFGDRPCERYAADVGPLLAELAGLRRLTLALADRVAAQSESLSRRAESVVHETPADGGKP